MGNFVDERLRQTKERLQRAAQACVETRARMEPGVMSIDPDESLASIAISLKRIADALNEPNEYGEVGSAALAGSIKRGLRD